MRQTSLGRMYRRNKTPGDVVTNDHCELIVVTSYTLGSMDPYRPTVGLSTVFSTMRKRPPSMTTSTHREVHNNFDIN